jgi:hypothetical protein
MGRAFTAFARLRGANFKREEKIEWRLFNTAVVCGPALGRKRYQLFPSNGRRHLLPRFERAIRTSARFLHDFVGVYRAPQL